MHQDADRSAASLRWKAGVYGLLRLPSGRHQQRDAGAYGAAEQDLAGSLLAHRPIGYRPGVRAGGSDQQPVGKGRRRFCDGYLLRLQAAEGMHKEFADRIQKIAERQGEVAPEQIMEEFRENYLDRKEPYHFRKCKITDFESETSLRRLRWLLIRTMGKPSSSRAWETAPSTRSREDWKRSWALPSRFWITASMLLRPVPERRRLPIFI